MFWFEAAVASGITTVVGSACRAVDYARRDDHGRLPSAAAELVEAVVDAIVSAIRSSTAMIAFSGADEGYPDVLRSRPVASVRGVTAW